QAHGRTRAGHAAAVLRSPAARGVHADRARARAGGGGRRARHVGRPPRAPRQRARARRVRAPRGDEVLLPPLRAPRPRRRRPDGAAAADDQENARVLTQAATPEPALSSPWPTLISAEGATIR